MEIIRIDQIGIAQTEMSRTQEEFDRFLKEFSENHLETKIIVGGYKITFRDGNEIILEPFKVVRVFEYDTKNKFQIAYEVRETWMLLLVFVFGSPIPFSMRFSFGSGTLFPFSHMPRVDNYMSSMLVKERDLEIEWNSKKGLLFEYLDYFTGKKKEALPFLWYGKGVYANDHISTFLNCYKSLELLAKEHWRDMRIGIRKHVAERFLKDGASPELSTIYNSVKLPKKFLMPLYFEETGLVQREKYDKWRKTRNKLTHGDWSVEFDQEFFKDVSEIAGTVKKALNRKLQEYNLPTEESQNGGRTV